MERRRPPDLDEALSSMLWKPYDRTPSISSGSSMEEIRSPVPLQKSLLKSTTASKKLKILDKKRFSYFDRMNNGGIGSSGGTAGYSNRFLGETMSERNFSFDAECKLRKDYGFYNRPPNYQRPYYDLPPSDFYYQEFYDPKLYEYHQIEQSANISPTSNLITSTTLSAAATTTTNSILQLSQNDHKDQQQENKNNNNNCGNIGDLDFSINNNNNNKNYKKTTEHNDRPYEFRVNQLHTNLENEHKTNLKITTSALKEGEENLKYNEILKTNTLKIKRDTTKNFKRENEFSCTRYSDVSTLTDGDFLFLNNKVKSRNFLLNENRNLNNNFCANENFDLLKNYYNNNNNNNSDSDMRLSVASNDTVKMSSLNDISKINSDNNNCNIAAAIINCSENSDIVTKTIASTTSTTVFVKSDNSRIFSNGTLIGALVSNDNNINNNCNIINQPSLTIQVNQGDHNNVDVKKSSSGVSIVNCYRAVPVNIHNQNLIENHINNNINENENNQVNNVYSEVNLDAIHVDNIQPERTFTSTEAQTDDLQEAIVLRKSQSPLRQISNLNQHHHNQTQLLHTDAILMSRDQRRRDRRDRRQARRPPHPHPHPGVHHMRPPFEILPDLLNSHLPPPYTTLPGSSNAPPPPPPPQIVSPIVSTVAVGPPEDVRYAFSIPVIRRSPSERSGKGCCGQWFAGPPLRAVIAVVALGGVACALGGVALGATGLAGPPASHLTAALLMIGVGVILVTVSGAAWRLTAPGTPACLGFTGADLGRCGRRPCGRSQHGLLYPEFQHRPPPPSYQASMQEYRLRLLLLDRDRQANIVRGPSPPPTYRSHNGTLMRQPLNNSRFNNNQFSPGSELSLPPSYRTISRPSRPQSYASLDDSNSIITSQPSSLNNHTNNNSNSVNNINNSSNKTPNKEIISEMNNKNNSTTTIQNLDQISEHVIITTTTSTPSTNATTTTTTVSITPNITTTTTTSDTEITKNDKNLNEILENNKNNSFTKIDNILCNNDLKNNITTINNLTAKDNNNYDNDLVTIVTISGCTDNDQLSNEMEILAHL